MLYAIAMGQIIMCHLRDLVTAGKNTEDINDHKGLRFVASLPI